MRSYSEKNWNLALWNGQKTFVSHPFYQQHLWRKLNGNHLKWDTCPWYWRAALVPFFILLYFLVFPFIVLFDIFSCNNDLLFESPAKLKKRKHDEHEGNFNIKAFSRGLVHTPICRIVIHHFLEALFLSCVFLSTVDPLDEYNVQDVQFYDVIMIIFVILYLMGDIVELWRAGARIIRSFWLIYNFVTSLFLMIGVITTAIGYKWYMDGDDRARLSGNHLANVGTTIFAMTTPLVMLRSSFVINSKILSNIYT